MTEERQNWVWITKPEYYLEEDGSERESLDPASGLGNDGSWWTCHPETQAGDLALLYRTGPKSDVAYLLEASTEARRFGSRPEDGIVTLSKFDELVERALAKEAADGASPFVRQAKDALDSAQEQEMKADRALRKYGWMPSELEQVRIDLERRELELGEKEREEGLDKVQAEWDRWDEEAEALTLVEDHAKYPDAVERSRESLAFEVFLALDMPEETTLETESEFKGRWVCGWESRYRFTSPVPITLLRRDGWLVKNWNALRANFKGSYFGFDHDVWERVIATAASNGNPDLPRVAQQHSKPGPSDDIVSEHQIRDALANEPSALGIDGLSVYVNPKKPDQIGVEYTCTGVGFIDLLMTDDSGDLTVVELKTKRAGQAVIGQIGMYMGWVKQNLTSGRPVRGVVVSDGYDAKYEMAASLLDLKHIEVSAVKARLGL